MGKDTKNKSDKEQENLLSIPDTKLPKRDDKNLIVNYWGKKVSNPNILVKFKDIPLLRAGGKLIIKSQPKAGKTSLAESLISSFINPECPSMGLSLRLYGRKKILFIDTEQSEFESIESYNRIWKRCGYDINSEEPKEETKKLIHVNLKRFLTDEMPDFLNETITLNDSIGLVIIDVITDFGDDSVMEMKDALKVLKMLNAIPEEIGIICNIHVNAGANIKAPSRGHIGRELERKCSACVYLTKESKDTTKIEIDLNRMGSNSEPFYCKWDDNKEMFIETEYVPPPDNIETYKEEINKCFKEEMIITTKHFQKEFFTTLRPNTTRDNFYFWTKKWEALKLIENPKKGIYKKCFV